MPFEKINDDVFSETKEVTTKHSLKNLLNKKKMHEHVRDAQINEIEKINTLINEASKLGIIKQEE